MRFPLVFLSLIGLLQAIPTCVGDDDYSIAEHSTIAPSTTPESSLPATTTEVAPSPYVTTADSDQNSGDAGDPNTTDDPPFDPIPTIQSTTSSPSPQPLPPAQGNEVDDQGWIVVLKNTKGPQISNHLRWIQGVSSDDSNPSHLSTNVSTIGGFEWYSGEFTPETLSKINNSDAVDYLVKDVKFTIQNTQRNPPSWGLSRISQRALPLNNQYIYPPWGGENVTVYVVDTGCNLKHNDLQGRATFGAAFLGNRTDEKDLNGHGSFVAGIITGKSFGVAKKAKVVCVRALQPDGAGRLSIVLQAIDWVTKQHMNSRYKKSIINLSLGAEFNQATNDAIKHAMDLGIHFSIAAGNEGKDACQFSPASVRGALTVGAINPDDTTAAYSNNGDCVDIYAPGTNINSIWNSSKSSTHTLSGTSMASPHVAGVMAILLSTDNYTPPELVKKIKEMATPFTAENQTKAKPGTHYPPLLLYSVLEENIAAIRTTSDPDLDSLAPFVYPNPTLSLGAIVALVMSYIGYYGL